MLLELPPDPGLPALIERLALRHAVCPMVNLGSFALDLILIQIRMPIRR